jgi:hypothetical protein
MRVVVDAKDSMGKWYVGIVVDEKRDLGNKGICKKVHFYEFNEKWDEWFNEDDIKKLAYYGTRAKDPADRVYSMQLLQRKTSRTSGSFVNFGTPYVISFGSWFTWNDAYEDIVL